MAETRDFVVIGAGISGLAFASTYLSVHPHADVVILEKETVLGGTWSRHRLYDHFYTQWSVGFGEFSNQSMTVPPKDDQYCGLFKSEHTTQYLEEYAANQTFGGRTLQDRILFSTDVTSAQKSGRLWSLDLEVTTAGTTDRRTLLAKHLILATGITTIPSVPSLPGAAGFPAPIIHNRDFGRASRRRDPEGGEAGILVNPAVAHVTVLGGGKSGADMVYASVKAGKQVAWIVRPTGTGPCTFVGAGGKAGFQNAFELASTRAPESLQPSYFAPWSWWNYLLHRTATGRSLVLSLFAAAHKEAVADADYANRPARGDFNKLVPHTPIFWRNNAAGIVNHGDFYETLADHVDVYYDDIASLSPSPSSPPSSATGLITLRSGRTISTSALLLGTGWQPSTSFLPPSLCARLGLPYALGAEETFPAAQQAAAHRWREAERAADAAVVARYPILGEPPAHASHPVTRAPWRLYNLMVPVGGGDGERNTGEEGEEEEGEDRSFACIGLLNTTNYFRTGEAQALWLTAWFDGRLTSSSSNNNNDNNNRRTKGSPPASLPSPSARRSAVASFIAWNKRRYLSLGAEGNSVSFDTLRYTDHLLRELGLRSHLPSSSSSSSPPSSSSSPSNSVVGALRWCLWPPAWWRWWKAYYFRPNAAAVYAGLREEYIRIYGGGGAEEEGTGVVGNGKLEGKKTV